MKSSRRFGHHAGRLAPGPWCAAIALIWAACGSQGGGDLIWQVNFACDSDGARAAQVRVGIVKGACPATEEPLYESAIARGGNSNTTSPGELPEGDYAFFATAFDANGAVVARACTMVTLPTEEAIELQLVGEGTCVAQEQDGEVCADVVGFVDADGYKCMDWKGYDCTRAKEEDGYSDAEEASLIENCAKTCGMCP